jgi:ATP-dependent protease ClpP protease subunit
MKINDVNIKVYKDSKNPKYATIDIFGYIGYEGWEFSEDENTARLIASKIEEIKSLKEITDLEIRVSSQGGRVDHALTIHDLLKSTSYNKTSFIMGMTASSGTIIPMAAEVRKMSSNALFLIHHCSSGAWGNLHDLEAEIESQKTVNDRILNIYLSVCKEGKEEDVKKLFDENKGNGIWITAKQAEEYGFITEIVHETKKTACISKSSFTNSKLPALPEGFEFLIAEDETGADPDQIAEKTTSKVLAGLKDFFDNLNPFKKDDTQKEFQDMKNLFPFLALAIALDAVNYDKSKGHTFSDEEILKIEASMKELADLKAKKLEDQISAKDTEISNLTTEKNNLQGIIDKIPAEVVAIHSADQGGGAADPNANYFQNRMKNHPVYKNVKNRLPVVK